MQNRKDKWQYIMIAVLMVVLALAMVGIPGGAGFSAVSPAVAAGSLQSIGSGIKSTDSTKALDAPVIDVNLAGLTDNATFGKVGIGADPHPYVGFPLYVYGGMALFQNPAGLAGFLIQRTNANRWILGANESGGGLGKGFSISQWADGASQAFVRLFINMNGRVGINTMLPDPTSRLTVYNDNRTYPNVAVYGQTPGGYTFGVGGTNDTLGSLGFVGGSYSQLGTNYGIGAYGANRFVNKSGSLGTPNEGVYGYNGGSGNAGYFQGNVHVEGNISKLSSSFRIDHPLDPANKYLQHSMVESPDMMNVYNGNIVLDSKGEAVVQLPAYFEALNKDFRYQLTCIGDAALVYVAQEIADNSFKIAGGKPGLKVSWQVTGIRHDTWAEANPIQVELEKSKSTVPAVQAGGAKQGWADLGSTPPAMSR